MSKTTYKYSKKACKPTVKVKDKNGKNISKTNYTVTYKYNVKPGTAYAVVKFKGNYKGQAKIKFNIKPLAPAKVKATKVNTSTGVSLSWKKAVGAVSYKVYRSVKGGKWTCLATTKKTKYKDKKATKLNTCYKYYVVSVAKGGVKSAKSKIVYTNKYTASKKIYTKEYNNIEYEVNQAKKTVTVVRAIGDYREHKGTLVIKGYVDGYPVTVIGIHSSAGYSEGAFSDLIGIIGTKYTKIVLPDTVLKIDAYAFAENTLLKSINLPKNLKYVGQGAFLDCSSFTGTLEIPDTLYCHPSFDDYKWFTEGSTELSNFSGLFNKGVTVKLPKTFTVMGPWEFEEDMIEEWSDTTFITPLKKEEIYVAYGKMNAYLDGDYNTLADIFTKNPVFSKYSKVSDYCPNFICAE